MIRVTAVEKAIAKEYNDSPSDGPSTDTQSATIWNFKRKNKRVKI